MPVLHNRLTIRVRYTAPVVWNLQAAQNELVRAFFKPMQIKAMSNSVWQSWCPPPVCILHGLQLDVCRACHGTAWANPSPGMHALFQAVCRSSTWQLVTGTQNSYPMCARGCVLSEEGTACKMLLKVQNHLPARADDRVAAECCSAL